MRIRMSVEPRNIDIFLHIMMEKYNYSDSDKEDVIKVYNALRSSMEPYAIYRINNRVTGIKAIDDNQCAVVAMTLGDGVDRLSESYAASGMNKEKAILDCIANELVNDMYMEFNEEYVRFHRRYISRYVFVQDDVSGDTLKRLLEEIYTRHTITCNDIRLNEDGTLEPAKSVAFYAVLTENPRAAM